MAGQGTKILASDFNQIQTIAANVLGTGSGQLGYGQPLTSNQVSIGTKITALGWQHLKNDLIKARQHQTGADESASIPDITTSNIVAENDRSSYLTFANLVQTYALNVDPTQTSLRTLSSPTRSTPWSGTLTHQVILTFSSANAARYYFNSGGTILFTASLDNTNTQLNTDWYNLLGAIGIISMNYNSTTQVANSASYPSAGSTPTGSPAGGLGFYQLNSTPQTIFTKNASTYSGDQYRILASIDATRSILTFRIQFQATAPGPGGGQVEQVTGTLASTVQANHASGSNVSMLSPTNYIPAVTSSGP
jgi:hypothetical protein